jgi:hypothetical protein
VTNDKRFSKVEWWVSAVKPVMMLKVRYGGINGHTKLQKILRVPRVVTRNKISAVCISLVQRCKLSLKKKEDAVVPYVYMSFLDVVCKDIRNIIEEYTICMRAGHRWAYIFHGFSSCAKCDYLTSCKCIRCGQCECLDKI